jgi:hypothetical protein
MSDFAVEPSCQCVLAKVKADLLAEQVGACLTPATNFKHIKASTKFAEDLNS